MPSAIALNYNKWTKYSYATLIGALELDKRVREIDVIFNSARRKLVGRLSKSYDHLFICYSIMSPRVQTIRSEIQSLCSIEKKNITYIAGGPHPTSAPEQTLHMGFDIVVMGEGECVFPELVYRIETDRPYADIKGIAYRRQDGGVQINDRDRPIDLDAYPPFALNHQLFAPIEVSRGCPWGCKYCQTPHLFRGTIRHRSIDTITKYAKIAVERGFRNTWFISPNALAYGSQDGRRPHHLKIRHLLRELHKIDGLNLFFGTFPSEVRPDFVTKEVIEEVTKYASNTSLAIGAQSGSQRLLEMIGRGHDVNDVYHAVDVTCDADLVPFIDVIFGLPGENAEDLEATKQMVMDVVQKGGRVNAHTFMPLPGTPYSTQRPGVINRETQRFLSSLAKKGKAKGHWRTQMDIAHNLYREQQTVLNVDRCV